MYNVIFHAIPSILARQEFALKLNLYNSSRWVFFHLPVEEVILFIQPPQTSLHLLHTPPLHTGACGGKKEVEKENMVKGQRAKEYEKKEIEEQKKELLKIKYKRKDIEYKD